MIITVLQDNTLSVIYNDSTKQTINSTHVHKAHTELVRKLAGIFEYKGATEVDPSYIPLVFNTSLSIITQGDIIIPKDKYTKKINFSLVELIACHEFFYPEKGIWDEIPIIPELQETVQV